MRETGGRLNPEIPKFTYQTYADLLANIPTSQNTSFGAPPHDVEDGQVQRVHPGRLASRQPLRAEPRPALRLLRHRQGDADDGRVDVEIVNYETPTDLRKLDFGPLRDPLKPYDPDTFNLGPRAGFAWTLNDAETTVVRGGVGYLYSPHLIATVRQSAANPYIPFRIVYNRTEIAAEASKWPMYTDDMPHIALRDAAGQQTRLLDLRHRHCRCPTPFSRWSACSIRSAARWRRKSAISAPTATTSRCSGSSRRRSTGRRACGRIRRSARPAATTSTAARRWSTTACRRRCEALLEPLLVGRQLHARQERVDAGRRPLGVLHRDVREQSGLLGSRIRSWTVEQRHPASVQRVVHLRTACGRGEGVTNGVLGGWQISGIVQARSGNALLVTQPSGIDRSRPDVVEGVDLIVADWKDTCTATGCNYLNTAGFARVPVSATTNATLRPGTYILDMARGPSSLNVPCDVREELRVSAGDGACRFASRRSTC